MLCLGVFVVGVWVERFIYCFITKSKNCLNRLSSDVVSVGLGLLLAIVMWLVFVIRFCSRVI